jgi:hypothetical protein
MQHFRVKFDKYSKKPWRVGFFPCFSLTKLEKDKFGKWSQLLNKTLASVSNLTSQQKYPKRPFWQI